MKPTLLIIHGMPGTGKTTLSKKLTVDLGLSLLGKDALKEFLFDTIGVGDLAWSQAVGRTTFDMLFVFIDDMLATGNSFMVECPFYRSFAVDPISAALKRNNARLIEIYCTTDPTVRRRRFIERFDSGNRHPGHADTGYYKDMGPDEPEPTQYEPLKLGKIFMVDTTKFGEVEYARLLQELRTELQEDKK